ncbi:exodeoxyribonuclease III [Simiduia litorea]|uniref:exodeoxyribonuclease III n=1 Tax=Simiduia litorea TaxID=1435348 RepID=UPI0036F20463
MRIINLSVDGLHQAAQRGLYDWLEEQDADIICLQDLRALEYELDHDVFHPKGYNAYFFDSGVKHYNGVAIYSRQVPKALIYGFGFASGVDMEGRYLQIDFDKISIGSLLAPAAMAANESQEVKMKFFDDLQAHLIKISRKRRDYVFCGNWAMAHKARDVKNASAHEGDVGYLPHERNWLNQLFTQIEYTDAFRKVNNDADEYSWLPTEGDLHGSEWRTDFQVVSNNLANRVEYATIYKGQPFSSHRPVIIDYDLEIE